MKHYLVTLVISVPDAPDLKDDGSCRVGRTNKLISEPMKLVFTENTPAPGKVIRVIRADRVWSGDFAHPDAAACRVIGDVAFETLEHFRSGRISVSETPVSPQSGK